MKRISILLIIFMVFSTTMFSQEESDERIRFRLYGIRTNWIAVPTGIDLICTIDINTISDFGSTYIYTKFGGGFQDKPKSRDDTTGNPLFISPNFTGSTFGCINFQWDIWTFQGLIKGEKSNFLETFLGYRGRFDTATEKINSIFPDRNTILGTSVIFGFKLNGSSINNHLLRTGLDAETSIEYGPSIINPIGGASYYRLNAKCSAFLPLFDINPINPNNIFSAYIGARVIADYAGGSSIPLFVMQNTGGQITKGSGGDLVRSFGYGQFDANIKLAGTVEAFILLPSLLGSDSLVPILTLFFDAGYYSQYARAVLSDTSGTFMATGTSISLNLFGFASPSFVIAFPLTENTEKPFTANFAFKFFLHM